MFELITTIALYCTAVAPNAYRNNRCTKVLRICVQKKQVSPLGSAGQYLMECITEQECPTPKSCVWEEIK